jgi:hypothetical protein
MFAARLLAAALAAASAAALYEAGDAVLQIATEKDFSDKVLKAPGLFLVECALGALALALALARVRVRVRAGAGADAIACSRPAARRPHSRPAQSTRRGAATARTWRRSGRRCVPPRSGGRGPHHRPCAAHRTPPSSSSYSSSDSSP